jgi:hypothetical protein
MSDAIKPALSPQEWAALCVEWPDYEGQDPPATVVMLDNQHARGPHTMTIESYGGRGGLEEFAFVDGERHVVAALALHGMPFGFTREDVLALDALLEMAYEAFGGHAPSTEADRDWQRGKGIRARIAALLPPEA